MSWCEGFTSDTCASVIQLLICGWNITCACFFFRIDKKVDFSRELLLYYDESATRPSLDSLSWIISARVFVLPLHFPCSFCCLFAMASTLTRRLTTQLISSADDSEQELLWETSLTSVCGPHGEAEGHVKTKQHQRWGEQLPGLEHRPNAGSHGCVLPPPLLSSLPPSFSHTPPPCCFSSSLLPTQCSIVKFHLLFPRSSHFLSHPLPPLTFLLSSLLPPVFTPFASFLSSILLSKPHSSLSVRDKKRDARAVGR